MAFPPEITPVTVALALQFVLTPVKDHTPSKLPPPPPPLFCEPRRGASAAGLPRRAGVSTERGASREPDSDFSSLPMLPPALPCARASPGVSATDINRQSGPILTGRRMAFRIMTLSQ